MKVELSTLTNYIFETPLGTVPHWKALRYGKDDWRGHCCCSTLNIHQDILKSDNLLHKRGFVELVSDLLRVDGYFLKMVIPRSKITFLFPTLRTAKYLLCLTSTTTSEKWKETSLLSFVISEQIWFGLVVQALDCEIQWWDIPLSRDFSSSPTPSNRQLELQTAWDYEKILRSIQS